MGKLFRRPFEYAKDHPAVVGSLLYAYLCLVGMVYDFTVLIQYNVNIFDYATTEDFFLAALKDPRVILLMFLECAILIVIALIGVTGLSWVLRWGFYRATRGTDSLRGASKGVASEVLWFLPVIAILIALVVPTRMADERNAAIRGGVVTPLSVVWKDQGISANSDFSEPLRKVAATTRFLFLWQEKTRRVYIVPLENVAYLMESSGELASPSHDPLHWVPAAADEGATPMARLERPRGG